MADDNNINKSSKTYNGQDPGRSSRVLDELSRVKQDWPKTPKAEELSRDLESIRSSLETSRRDYVLSPNNEQLETIQNIQQLESQYKKELQESELSYHMSANVKAARETRTATKFENVNRATTTMASSSEFYSRIRRAPDLMHVPTEIIQQNIEEQTRRVSQLGEQQVNALTGLRGSDVTPEMRQRADEIRKAEEDIALNKRLIKMQSRSGMSTEKRLMAGEEEILRTSEMLGSTELSKKVAAQKFNVDDETEKLSKALEKLTTTFGEFDQATSD
jgi:hypothetical protein